MDAPGERINIKDVLKEYEKRRSQSLSSIEEYLLDNHDVMQCICDTLESQLRQYSSQIFEWLYNMVTTSKGSSKKLFLFVSQFIPDIIYLCLHSTTAGLKELKVVTEALLKRIIVDTEQTPPIQIPDLSRPSIYHQTTTSVSSNLTIAALTRHDQSEVNSTTNQRPLLFAGNETVTSTNRLLFLTTALIGCVNNVSSFSSMMQKRFCQILTLVTLRGMNSSMLSLMEPYSSDYEDCVSYNDLTALAKEKRFVLNDDFLSLTLQGIRTCLCQPAHYVAKQSLQAVKLRSQYEVFPLSIQVSSTLERLTVEMNPLKLPFDPESHKTYSPRDKTHWPSRPMTILRSFTGQLLHHHLNAPPTEPRPLSVDFSCDDERFLSESFASYGNRQDTNEGDTSIDSNDGINEGSQVTITISSPQRSIDSDNQIEMRPVAMATIGSDGSVTSGKVTSV